jgi:hypothetical protein
MLGRGVDGGDVCFGVAGEQGEGAGSGPAAQVHDVTGEVSTGSHSVMDAMCSARNLCVQVEDLRLAVGVDLGLMVRVTVCCVRASMGHSATLK